MNIVDVIGRTVNLKKSGSRWLGLCPFHKEKTPSFFVNEDMQTFKCFGCGASGDVINYVERKYNLSFLEASERLANEFGFELPKGTFDTNSKKTMLYDANRMAAAFFHNSIRRPGNAGLDYMTGRGITTATITKFGIGYAGNSWDDLYEHLIKNGIKMEVGEELGLVRTNKGRTYDNYRNRVMFPIINTRNKVVGFGGRVIKDDDIPKYKNSSDSRAFNKSNNLYAINITKDSIKNEDQAVLVEGYMDVISLYQSGIKNVVAGLGTALTPGQANLIKRYTSNVVVAYDSDTAGQEATLRNIEVLKKAGLNVKVLDLKECKDPDEFVKKYGHDAFLDQVEEAITFMSFKLARIKDKYDLDTEDGSVGFLKEAAVTVSQLTPVEAEFYIKKIADENDISEEAIKREAFGKKMGINNSSAESDNDGFHTGFDEIEIIERNLIRLILHNSGFLRRIGENNYSKIFKTPVYYRVYENIKELYVDDDEINLDKLKENLEGDDADIITEIMQNVPLGAEPSRQLEELLMEIELIELDIREKEILEVLNDDREETVERSKELTEEIQEIFRRKNEIKEW